MVFPRCPESETTADRASEGQVTRTIDILPDDALLEIFTFHLLEETDTEAWHALVHVCGRWRRIVYASPRRLGLCLLCTPRRRVKEMLDIWPALPLVIRGSGYAASQGKGADDGIIAALKHNDRVHQILLDGFSSSLLEEVVAVMQVPFPALTNLEIISWGETATVVPEAFLGRSAQRLQSCILQGIAFPGQWKLLLTANHLVILRLEDIPHSGYISPDTMVTCLSAMPNLKQLDLGFRSSRSRPDRASQRPPLLIRVIHLSHPLLVSRHQRVHGRPGLPNRRPST